MRQELGGCYQVNIVGALILQGQENTGKLTGGQFFSDSLLADLKILTEAAAESTAGEKYGAASLCTADGRFFPHMKGGSGNFRFGTALAESRIPGAVHTAHTGTQTAVCIGAGKVAGYGHRISVPFIDKIIWKYYN